MILVFGGIKGGVGKTTLSTTMAVLRAQQGKDVLLVDADDQGTATDFTTVRNQTLANRGGAGYTSVQLYGAAVRSEVLRLINKYDDILIDVGGRDTAGQRAALSVADIYLVPFLPGSFDVWTLDTVGSLVNEARTFNQKVRGICLLNRADAKGTDNAEASAIAAETLHLEYLSVSVGNRKAFRSAAAQGLTVTEVKPRDPKAIAEVMKLFKYLFDI